MRLFTLPAVDDRTTVWSCPVAWPHRSRESASL